MPEKKNRNNLMNSSGCWVYEEGNERNWMKKKKFILDLRSEHFESLSSECDCYGIKFCGDKAIAKWLLYFKKMRLRLYFFFRGREIGIADKS